MWDQDKGHLLLSACLSALFVGCGGPQLPITSREPASQSVVKSVRPAHLVPLLYVANASGDYNDVTVYHAKGKEQRPIGVISNGLNTPFGACLDSAGTLYVTNERGWAAGFRNTLPARRNHQR